MGWNDEYKKIPQGVKKPEDFSRVNNLCQKPITLTGAIQLLDPFRTSLLNRFLAALAPLELAINEYMESLQYTRLADERKVLLNKSLWEAEEFYKSFLLAMHPKAP